MQQVFIKVVRWICQRLNGFFVKPSPILAYSGILWHTLAYSGILWHTLAYSGILWHNQCIINNCWRSVPLPCGQYMAIFFFIFLVWELLPLRKMRFNFFVDDVDKNPFNWEVQITPLILNFIFFTFHWGKIKMPQIGPKINNIEIWSKSGLKVIISWNKSPYGNIGGMFEL